AELAVPRGVGDGVESGPRARPGVARVARRRGERERRVARGPRIGIAYVAPVRAAGRRRSAAGDVRVCIEVPTTIRLQQFEPVDRARVDAVILIEAVQRDLLGIDVVDEQ